MKHLAHRKSSITKKNSESMCWNSFPCIYVHYTGFFGCWGKPLSDRTGPPPGTFGTETLAFFILWMSLSLFSDWWVWTRKEVWQGGGDKPCSPHQAHDPGGLVQVVATFSLHICPSPVCWAPVPLHPVLWRHQPWRGEERGKERGGGGWELVVTNVPRVS